MYFILSGIDDQSNERELEIKISQAITTIKIDKNELLNINSKDIFRTLRNYNNNYGGGQQYQDREYYRYFEHTKINTCIENMIRAFAVSSSYLQFHESDSFSDAEIRFKISSIKEHLNNRLLIDWTGDLNIQPQMYFLSTDLITNHKKEVDDLYNLRILQKYQLIEPQKIECYYVPFILPNVNNFNLFGRYGIWKQINKGINDEIKRLTNNRMA